VRRHRECWDLNAAARRQNRLERRMLTRAQGNPAWSRTASCNLQAIAATMLPYERVTGSGVGSSEQEACRNAKREATQAAPRGTYARHCRCRCMRM